MLPRELSRCNLSRNLKHFERRGISSKWGHKIHVPLWGDSRETPSLAERARCARCRLAACCPAACKPLDGPGVLCGCVASFASFALAGHLEIFMRPLTLPPSPESASSQPSSAEEIMEQLSSLVTTDKARFVHSARRCSALPLYPDAD